MTSPGAGGVQQSIVPYALAFRNLGYEIQILIYSQSELIEPLLGLGFKLTRTFTCLVKRKPSWFHVIEVGYHLWKFHPDIIFAFGDKGFPVIDRLKPQCIVISRCGASEIERVLRLKNSNAILVTSNKTKEIAIAGGIDQKKLHVIRNFTVPNKMPVNPGSPRSKLTVGAMGRLVTVKGFDILISAVAHLRESGVDLDLVIAGAGCEGTNLRRISDEMGVNTNFIGWVKDQEKLKFLQSLDIFVSPSRDEPFGFVFLEAMELGLPIVATNTIGAQEIFKNHYGALISEIENPISLAKNIHILLSSKSLMQEMGEANQLSYFDNFSIEAGTRRLAEVMKAIKQEADRD
jgi:glycosyltransferase involved in cell wall biosynthesis